MKKLSLFKINRQLNLSSLSYSWNFYLYLLKYNVLIYYTYDGMQTNLIQKIKSYLNKNKNKLLIMNKQQISYFFRATECSDFNWLKTGRHLIIMFNNFQETIEFFDQSIAKQLNLHYKLITISHKGVYINLLWDREILSHNYIIKLYKQYNKQNATVLFLAIYWLIIGLICHINNIIYTIITTIKILNEQEDQKNLFKPNI